MFTRLQCVNENRLYVILRILLGIVFVWASWNKIADPESFARIIQNYRILPPVFVNPTALILPWLEAACGIFLITGYFVRGSAFIVDILLTMFILVFIINFFRGIDANCGCFSLTLKETKGFYRYLIRDLLFLCTGLWIFFYRIRTDN